MEQLLSNLLSGWEFAVFIAGSVTLLLAIVGGLVTVAAWSSKIAKPLWRLGLGLARKTIVIVAATDDAESLKNLINKSAVFSEKRIKTVSSKGDTEDISDADVLLFKYSGSPFSLSEVLAKKPQSASIVVYAKPGEITDKAEWDLMDQHRNISVCNLKGRLLNDLLTLMMTTKL